MDTFKELGASHPTVALIFSGLLGTLKERQFYIAGYLAAMSHGGINGLMVDNRESIIADWSINHYEGKK